MQLPENLQQLADNRVISLAHYGVIEVTGEQCDEFLHGQLTVDVKNLPDNQARRAAHCDFKGKTWALSTVCRFNMGVLLSVHRDALDQSLAQLNKYGVFSKITLQDASEDYSQYLVHGPLMETFVTQTFGEVPESVLQVVASDCGVAIRQDYPADHFLLLLDSSGRQQLQDYLREHQVASYDPAVFEALCVANGIPDVSGDNINQFVPQMMNVQALNGIDFNKGCYMGQEVVARTRYLGKNKRAAFAFRLAQTTNVEPGDKVEQQLGENWRSSGTVLRAATLGKETWILAVMPKDSNEDGHFRLAGCPEPALQICPLPYPLESGNSQNVR